MILLLGIGISQCIQPNEQNKRDSLAVFHKLRIPA